MDSNAASRAPLSRANGWHTHISGAPATEATHTVAATKRRTTTSWGCVAGDKSATSETMTTLPKCLSFFAVVVVVGLSACVAPTEALPSAAAHWSQCTPCHGANGEGNVVQLAPAIAGLPAWYVDAQLLKFRAGARGSHFDDIAGLRMRPMALSLLRDADVKNMAEYVAQLPPAPSPPSLAGDTTAGKGLFATCAACHGADGGGNELMNAPPIAGRDDWYLYAQLQKFKSGVRGTNAKDATGPAMRAIAMSLPDDKALHDVARFVAELPPANSSSAKVHVDKGAPPADIEAAIKAIATESQLPH